MLTPRRKDDLTLLALIVVFVFSAVDVVDDYGYGASTSHLIGEAVVMLMALAGVLMLWSQRESARRQAAGLGRDLERAQAEARRFEGEARHTLHGLGHAMARQFDRWGLSVAEREVTALLLKGLRHKEIAALRGTSERTVRQQAFTVYRKAGLTSRTELAAFFLDGALAPAVEVVERKEPEPVSA
ncbi:MAG TPA: helix-turn-helix transcriptional regulator [Vicinamibacteria bacterium]|nr:helix-turn-helix transcriptional regulator [Vicinamibacteria bacterium]